MLAGLLRRLKAKKERFDAEAGVTLVEMMVVIVIIGLVTAIVVINVLPAQDTARMEKAKADIRTLEQALELYRLDRARYPSGDEGLNALVQAPAPTTGAGAAVPRESYVRRLPNDPWGQPYRYSVPGKNGAYDLYSLGADAQEGGEGANADIGNWQ
ncbi:MAG: type II secretion system major pseudopilin GspG [Hyphomonadaceae bacterium]|nr:type II secretion system major pseudopilin GspG [Hyphomonadaceae bacterium]